MCYVFMNDVCKSCCHASASFFIAIFHILTFCIALFPSCLERLAMADQI